MFTQSSYPTFDSVIVHLDKRFSAFWNKYLHTYFMVFDSSCDFIVYI